MDSCWRCRTLRQDDAHVRSVPSDARLRYDDEPERDPDADAVRRASGAGRGRRKAVLVLGSLRTLPPDGWRVRVGCGALDSRPARQVRGHASPASRPRQSRPPRPAGSASTPATRPATSTAPARPEEASVAPSFPREAGPLASAGPGASGHQSGSVRGRSLAGISVVRIDGGVVSELRPASQSSVSGPANTTEAGCFPSLSAARCRSQAARALSSRSTGSSPSATAARA